MTGYVYAFLDDSGDVLYIGSTNNFERRRSQHRRKPWWPQVADFAVHPESTIERAREVEAQLIVQVKPTHNAVGMTIDERIEQILATPPWCHEPSPELVEQAARVWASVTEAEAA